MKYIKEIINFNEDDFDWMEEDPEINFDFILNKIKTEGFGYQYNPVILKLSKKDYSEFQNFCKNNNIGYMPKSSFWSSSSIFIYVRKEYLTFTTTYNGDNHNRNQYPNIKVYDLTGINESIDFDENDWEYEEEEISKEELIKYDILVDSDKECIIVVKKLKNLGFNVYNYDNIMEVGRSGVVLLPSLFGSGGGCVIWRKLRYNNNNMAWARSNVDTNNEQLDFKTFMEMF